MRIVREDVVQFFDECHPRLSEARAFYLNRPEALGEDRAVLTDLSDHLWLHHDALNDPALMNQRSYQLFGHEKLLNGRVSTEDYPQKEAVKRMLRRCHLTGEPDSLNYVVKTVVPVSRVFQTPENPCVLIVENLDPYLTLIEQVERGTPIPFDALIWGAGKQIESALWHAQSGTMGEIFQAPSVTYYYVGDLDVEGVQIFRRLKARYPHLSLRYLPGYIDTLVHHSRTSGWREAPQRLSAPLVDELLADPDLTTFLGSKPTLVLGFWQADQMLPQEVMTTSEWLTYLSQLSLSIVEPSKSGQTPEERS